MTDINPVGISASSATLREYANLSPGRRGGSSATEAVKDRVEISELAGFLSRLAELPEDRARKVVEIRNAIANGGYETEDRLNSTTERLLDAFSVNS